MRRASTPLAILMALLVVLWQSLCLCHTAGEGGHGHGGLASASAESHHANDSTAQHTHVAGDDEHDPSSPCDDHGDGCDCTKLLTVAQKGAESGKLGSASFLDVPVAWEAPSFLRAQIPVRVRRPGVPREALPPPPILALHCQLLI